MCTIAWPLQARPSLELKTQPRFRPVSLSLFMAKLHSSPTRKEILSVDELAKRPGTNNARFQGQEFKMVNIL